MSSDELFLTGTLSGLERDKSGRGLCSGQNQRSDDRPGEELGHLRNVWEVGYEVDGKSQQE